MATSQILTSTTNQLHSQEDICNSIEDSRKQRLQLLKQSKNRQKQVNYKQYHQITTSRLNADEMQQTRSTQRNWLEEYSLSPKHAAMDNSSNSGRVEKHLDSRVEKLLQLWRSQTECNKSMDNSQASYRALNSSRDQIPVTPSSHMMIQGQFILPNKNHISPKNSYLPSQLPIP